LESYELDEDKVIDEIDEIMKQGELYEIFHPKKRVFLILLGKSSSSSLPVFICVSMSSFRFISILAACHNLPITHPMTLTYIKRKRNCIIYLIFRNNSSTVGSPYLSELSSVPYRTATGPSIVLKNSAKSTINAIFYQNVWRF